MAKITDKDLFEFVYRADTSHKIAVADKWLREHKHLMSPHTFDELITILSRTSKALSREHIREVEERLNIVQINANDGLTYYTDTFSGEVVATA